MAKLVFKPLSLAASVLGGVLAGAVFRRVWKLVDAEDAAPEPTDRERGWSEILAAATMQGAVFGLVQAALDRASAVGFARATGSWPKS